METSRLKNGFMDSIFSFCSVSYLLFYVLANLFNALYYFRVLERRK